MCVCNEKDRKVTTPRGERISIEARGESEKRTHIVQRAYFTPVEQQRVFAHNYKHESLPTVHVSGG